MNCSKQLFVFAVAVLAVVSSCTKQLTPFDLNTLSTTTSSISPNLLQGPCPYPCTDQRCKAYSNGYCGPADTTVDLVNQADSNANTTSILTSAYNELSTSVNFSELSTEMGITVSTSAIDFSGGLLSYDLNNQFTFNKVLGCNFYQNGQNVSTLYGFAWIADSPSLTYGQPFMVKVVKGQYFTLYDLTNGYEYTVSNYTSKSATFTERQGSYIINGGQLALGRVTPLAVHNCSGANVMACITDAYTNHGWASVWVSLQTAFIPMTAVGIGAGCAAINCISHKD